MSENQQNQEQQPQFALQRIYIKDLSFESPKAPEIFKGPVAAGSEAGPEHHQYSPGRWHV